MRDTQPNAASQPPREAIPIVFIHVGAAPFIQESVAQAHESNPASRIVVIGKGLCPLPDYCDVVNIEDYPGRHLFRLIYRHLSPNSYGYELFCLQRWIVLRDYMRRNRLPCCLYLDSDVMLYSDATRETERFAGYDATYSRESEINASPHTCFILNRNVPAKLVRLLVRIYLTPGGWLWLRRSYRILQKSARGISDMTLFALAADRGVLHIANLNAIQADGTRYDGTISNANGLLIEEGRKKIVWDKGHPHTVELETGRLIRMHTLHFQGRNKPLMSSYRSDAHRRD